MSVGLERGIFIWDIRQNAPSRSIKDPHAGNWVQREVAEKTQHDKYATSRYLAGVWLQCEVAENYTTA